MDITLRKWKNEDKKRLSEICINVDRTYLAKGLPKEYSEKDAEEWIVDVKKEDGKSGIYRAIILDGKVVGEISVEKKYGAYGHDAEIGYLLDSNAGSHGVMTEAVKQICEIAFSELNIIRITGLVYAPNTASRRVLEKNGFVLEGTMKNAVYQNEKLYDLCIYGKQNK